MATQVQITFDSPDPARIAEFWAAALGYVVHPPPPGFDSWPAFLTHVGVPEHRFGHASPYSAESMLPRLLRTTAYSGAGRRDA